jgi:hypothetical protein
LRRPVRYSNQHRRSHLATLVPILTPTVGDEKGLNSGILNSRQHRVYRQEMLPLISVR